MGININQSCEQGLVECLQAICASKYRDNQGNPVGEFDSARWRNEFQYVEEQYSVRVLANEAVDFYTEMVTGSNSSQNIVNKNKRAASALINNNPSLCFPPKTGMRVPYLSSIPNSVPDGKSEFSMLPDSVLTTQLSPIPSHVWYEDVVKWSDDFFMDAGSMFSEAGVVIRDNAALLLISIAGLGVMVGEGLKGAGEPRAVFFGNVIEGISGFVALFGTFVANLDFSTNMTNDCVSTNDSSTCRTNRNNTSL